MKNGIFFTKSLVFIGFNHFGTEPNFQVQVRAKAEPNIRFRFRFGAKSAEPGPNWTVASLLILLIMHVTTTNDGPTAFSDDNSSTHHPG